MSRRQSSDSGAGSWLLCVGIFGFYGAMKAWEFIRPHLEAIGICGAALAGMLILCACLRNAARQQQQASAIEKAEAVAATPVLPGIPFPVNLQRERYENAYHESYATLMRWRQTRVGQKRTVGAYAGRGRGVYGSVSQWESRPVAEMYADDKGALLLTDRRIVFRGNRRTLDIPYTSLGGFRYEDAMIVLERLNRDTVVLATDVSTAAMLQRLLNGSPTSQTRILSSYVENV